MISELNRRVTVNKYTFSQNADGGNDKDLDESYELWAKVELLNGNRAFEGLQITFREAYKITTRYEISRRINLDDEIIYEDQKLIIHSIKEDSEGNKKFNIITAYSTVNTA